MTGSLLLKMRRFLLMTKENMEKMCIRDRLWPTSNIAVGCGISGVPLSKWWKFFLPLYGLMYVTQMLIIVFAQLFLGF